MGLEVEVPNCVIQRASGAEALVVSQTSAVTAMMCKSYGLTHWVRTSGIVSRRERWDRWSDLRDWLQLPCPEGDVAVVLDSDVVWVWPYANVTLALDDGFDFGAVRSMNGSFDARAMFVRRTPAARELVRRVLAGERPGVGGLNVASAAELDQAYLDQELPRSGARVQTLLSRWNDSAGALHRTPGRVVARRLNGKNTQCRIKEAAQLAPELIAVLKLYDRRIPEREVQHLVL